jgi:Xaa-Pro aminopeptidase
MVQVVPETHARRRAALRASLQHADQDLRLDAVLVTNLLNVRYLTGFTGSNAALLVAVGGDEESLFCTDARYQGQATEQVPDLRQLIERGCDVALAGAAAKAGCQRLGFDSRHVTIDGLTGLTTEAEGCELVRAPGLVEQLRMIKDDGEVEALRMACAAADAALADLLTNGAVAPGRTELEVAYELEGRMRDYGARGPSFESIVAAGANSAVPHHRPTNAVLHQGDLLKLDFGALVDGYHSDMTRTVVLGEPAGWQQELYELVAAAQAAGCAALRPGAEVREVDAAARSVIEGAGYGDQFMHGLGHGVGLEIHEAPMLAKVGEGKLSAGMTVTVEPGVYLAGRGGVRIEDTLVVRDEAPELLTLTTKQLVVV